jgi:hypothetical protein
MPIDLYLVMNSPPCVTVLTVAKHLGIDLNLKVFQMYNGDHLNPDFIKVFIHLYTILFFYL